MVDSACQGIVISDKFGDQVDQSTMSNVQLRFADQSLSPPCPETNHLLTIKDSYGRIISEYCPAVIGTIGYDMIIGEHWLIEHKSVIFTYLSSVVFNLDDVIQPFARTLAKNNHKPRWNIERKKPLARRKPIPSQGTTDGNSRKISFCSLRQVRKAIRNRRTRIYMAACTYKPQLNAIELESIEKEAPEDTLDLNPDKTLDERLDEKFGKDEMFKNILREFPSLIPTELPAVKDLQDRITHKIHLNSDAQPRSQGIYHCSEPEREEMKRQITELLKAGHIRHSFSPWSSSVLFVKKKGTDKLRMCIDFRHLNKCTIKDSTAIARIDELRQRLRGSKCFTALDLMSGYYQIRIDDESIPLTAFNCRYGHFEWTVMPFGLCNAPATFTRWINLILNDLLDTCVVAYLDDILIYSPTEEQHVIDVRQTLERLAKANAFLSLDKCVFNARKVEFLGHEVDGEGITLNPGYVQPIMEWPDIMNKSDLASFCGMVNYFKNWIDGYADICKPLNELRKKDIPFIWTVNQQSAVRILQHSIATAPVLVYFDPAQVTTIYTDASAYAVGGWLGQRANDSTEAIDRPVLFYSRKMNDAETRYGTHERELLAIVEMLRVTRPYVEGRSFIVKTDHAALKWLQTQPQLSRRQASWVEKIQAFDMKIEYQPGKYNHVADALSRRPDYMPNCPRCQAKITIDAGGSERNISLDGNLASQTLTTDDPVFSINVITVAATQTSIQMLTIPRMKSAMTQDELAWIGKKIAVKKPGPTWKLVDGVGYYGSRMFVPQALRNDILYEVHDIGAVHPGDNRTVNKLAMNFYWPSMGKDARQWIRTCDNCQRKHRSTTSGQLRSLPIAKQRFSSVAMDWFAPPTLIDGYSSVLLVVDRHRKFLTLIPGKVSDTAELTAKQYLQHVYVNAGIPEDIVVDRDTRWCSAFWQEFSSALGIKMNMATARHQNTNGLAESAVKQCKRMLTSILNAQRARSWVDALPIIAFAYNDTPHMSTGFTPFELTYGTSPMSITSGFARGSGASTANEILENVQRYEEAAVEAMEKAQQQQEKQFNKGRSPTRTLEEGSQCLLSRDGIEHAISSKYIHPFIGPFMVKEAMENDNYLLELPPTMKIHPIFHISKLRQYTPSYIPQQQKGI